MGRRKCKKRLLFKFTSRQANAAKTCAEGSHSHDHEHDHHDHDQNHPPAQPGVSHDHGGPHHGEQREHVCLSQARPGHCFRLAYGNSFCHDCRPIHGESGHDPGCGLEGSNNVYANQPPTRPGASRGNGSQLPSGPGSAHACQCNLPEVDTESDSEDLPLPEEFVELFTKGLQATVLAKSSLAEGEEAPCSSTPLLADTESEPSEEHEHDHDHDGWGCMGYCAAHKTSCEMCCMDREGAKLRGMKDWRPIDLNFHDQQFVLRQAKKFQVDATKSKLLQFVLTNLKKASEDDGMAPKQVPRFARKKVIKRKVYSRQDFPKFELTPEEEEGLMRPYAYLELLDHRQDDGLLLISLTEMIGINKMRRDMIAVFEKNFGCDIRMENFKSDLRKRNGRIPPKK